MSLYQNPKQFFKNRLKIELPIFIVGVIVILILRLLE